MRHTWAHKILPPLALVVVAGPVWYASSNHTKLNSTPQASASTTTASAVPAVANQTAIPSITPTVQQSDGLVHVSIDTTAYAHVQKVEFYLENELVGAAYAKPYIVSLDASAMQAGNHQVSAKIYTGDSTMQTQPATFTPQPSTQSKPVAVTTEPITSSEASAEIVRPTASPTLAAPINIIASAGSDGITANIQWQAVTGADSYQIWRDGVKIAAATTPSYNDNGLQPGRTYDYQIVAVSDALVSESSDIAAVTMPMPSSAKEPSSEQEVTPANESVAPTDSSK